LLELENYFFGSVIYTGSAWLTNRDRRERGILDLFQKRRLFRREGGGAARCFLFGRSVEVARRTRGFGGDGGFTVRDDAVADLVNMHAQPLCRAALAV
jgi:hypothetical protein